MDKQMEAFYRWKNDPSPDNASAFLKEVEPIISKAIQSYGGSVKNDPVMRGHAKRIVLQSIKKYDPKSGSLNTYLSSHLRGLMRKSLERANIISVPERVFLENKMLNDVANEIRQEKGREPTDDEIADATGLSMARIKYVRSFRVPTPEGTFAPRESDGENEVFEPSVAGKDEEMATLQFMYYNMPPIDKTIMEFSLGMNNKPILSNNEIASKLKVSPEYISQRKKKILEKFIALSRTET